MNSSNDFRSRLILNIINLGKIAERKKLLKPILMFIYNVLDKLIIQLLIGAYIPFKTKIGTNLILPHGGLGVIINPDSIIGDNVVIYHQVTIGGLGLGNLGQDYLEKNIKKQGAPHIGDNVFIGTGAKILGNVNIGNNVKIGANAVVVCDIPENCTAIGCPAKVIKN